MEESISGRVRFPLAIEIKQANKSVLDKTDPQAG